jgi:glycosyltransferase involved in cell wall biosynthesis
MSNNNLISIITPTYNSERYIKETINSILSQTYQNWELLITDDCSTDNTCEIVDKYVSNDSRIKLFRQNANCGAGAARNNSIKEAKGRYMAFCDSDDRWYPDKLEKQIAFMKKMDCGLSYTSYITCNEEGENKGIIVCRKKETFATTKRDDKIGCLTAMYDTEKVGKVYMPLIRKRQDWGLMLNILKKCDVAYGIKEPLAIYRLRSGSISSNKKSLVKYNIGLYQEVLGWSKIRASIFFCFVFMPSYVAKKIFVSLYNR